MKSWSEGARVWHALKNYRVTLIALNAGRQVLRRILVEIVYNVRQLMGNCGV